MDEYIETVVQEKPMRGREMKTDIVPTDMFDTMKLVSAKKTLRGKSLIPELEQKGEKQAELYHEGYVDGKLYLVPDSNLQAMRDIINFKMKPRRSTHYKHQTSFELTEYDHFRGKLHTLLEKIEEIESESESEGESESEEEEEQVEEEDKKEEEVKREEEEEKVEEKIEEEEEEEEKEEPPPKPMRRTDPNRLRFLISGHFQENKKPIYIIQDYRGGPDLFTEQKADFYSKQMEDDVDLKISGRFYDERILEEHQGKPKALNIKPHKILIDEKTSNVYDEYFEQVYKFNKVNISLRGEFIKSKITKKTTPFLKIDVKQKYPAEPNIRSEREENYYGTPSTAVLVFKPEYNNPFGKGDENHYIRSIFDDDIQSDALVLQSSIVASMPTLPTMDEQIKHKKVEENYEEDEICSGQNMYDDNLKTIVSVKPFDIYTRKKLANMADNNYIDCDKKTQGGLDVENPSENIIRRTPRSKDWEHFCIDNDHKHHGKKLKKNNDFSFHEKSTTGSNSSPILHNSEQKTH